MSYVTAVFAVLIRLLRPTRGVHVSPLGYARELAGELLRRRARRVRRYVRDLSVFAEADVEPAEEEVPVMPAPRRPVDDTLTTVPRQTSVPGECPGWVFEADAAVAIDDLVPDYYRAWERRHKLLRIDRSRSGPAVLRDLAGSEFWTGVSA